MERIKLKTAPSKQEEIESSKIEEETEKKKDPSKIWCKKFPSCKD